MLMFTSEGDGRMDAVPAEELQAMYARVDQWWTAHSASLLEGYQVQPASTATTVAPRTGVVTDGPFLEAKESIGGYAIVEAPDLDTVIAMAKTWPASPKVEIRPVLERDGM
jgi:hypothetical protein